MRYVTDIGAAGPDKGEGGKFLILPPGYAAGFKVVNAPLQLVELCGEIEEFAIAGQPRAGYGPDEPIAPSQSANPAGPTAW